MFYLQHSQVRANPVVARTISQSSISTPIKSTPAVTVKMPTTAPVAAPVGTAVNVTTPDGSASRGVGGVAVKQESLSGTQTAQKTGVLSTEIPVLQVSILIKPCHAMNIYKTLKDMTKTHQNQLLDCLTL